MPFLPRSLTRYIASSAAWISSSADAATSGSVATPTEAVRRMSRPSPGRNRCAAMRSRMRSPTAQRALAAGVGQDQRELVAAEPRDDVGFARARADHRRRFDQRPAAEQMPVGVVDRLEAVEIDEQQRQRPAAARGALGFAPQHLRSGTASCRAASGRR